MNPLQLEAEKCLLCKKPRCQHHCPINTDIPKIISLYKENRLEEGGQILFENNPLSIACSIVCPHENQCLGHCIKGIKQEPVKFHEIEYEISRNFLENHQFINRKKDQGRIAVIGSGPAGITIAFDLADKGYDVTIFEKHEKIGGILTYGIPEFRLPKSNIDLLEKALKSVGVKIRINTTIGPIITLDKLFQDGYQAIFIGTGVWNPKPLHIPGETLGHVHYAINYLRSPHAYDLGKKTIIIGAGNVAMDAARSAKRFGCEEVIVAYRKDVEHMTATKAEIKETLEDGVVFDLFKSPVKIVDEGIILADVEKIQDGENITYRTVPESEKLYLCDSVIIAISQSPANTIVINNKGLDTHQNGLLLTTPLGKTTREGVFACGDVTSGARTVIEAVVAAKSVAQTIDQYCKNKSSIHPNN